MPSRLVCFLCVLLGCFLSATDALYERHRILGTDSWKFVTKFCFNPDVQKDAGGEYKGKFMYDISFPVNTTLKWFVYYHGEESWDLANNEDLNCFQKATIAQQNGNVFPLYTKPERYLFQDDDPMFDEYVGRTERYVGELVFKSERPRWFYFALGNCHSPLNGENEFSEHHAQAVSDEIKVSMSLKMYNGDGVEKHFSADELGKLKTYLTFFILYCILLLCPIMFVFRTLKGRKMLHHTVKMMMLAAFLETLSTFFYFLYQASYAQSGYQYLWLEMTGMYLHATSDVVLLTLFLVIGKGWTIVRRKISAQGRVKLGMFVTMYAVVYYVVIIWFYNVEKDPRKVQYFYDSPPGQVLQWLRMAAALWFTYGCHTTRSNYQTKRGFYKLFYFIGLFWIVSLPFQVWIANTTLKVWYRAAFVANFECTYTIMYFIGLIILFWPSRFNRNFPFHAKTQDMEGPPADKKKRAPNSRFGSHNKKESKKGSNMHPAGFNRMPGSNLNLDAEHLRKRNTSVSGGMNIMGNPEERIQSAVNQMRNKISSLHTYSDDIEYALEELRGMEDSDEEDLPDEDDVESPPDDIESGFPSNNDDEGETISSEMELPSVRPKRKKKRKSKKAKKPGPPSDE